MPDLCLTLAEDSLEILQEKIRRYSGKLPLLEVRLDYLRPPSLPTLPSGSSTAFIATCRPPREGGRFEGDEEERLRLLGEASRQGFQWVDLEHDVAGEALLAPGCRVVRSYHHFQDFPQDLHGLWRRLLQKPGDVYKLALSVGSTSQTVRLLRFLQELPSSPPHILIGMGALGQLTRSLGAFLGNRWTYVCEKEGEEVAGGQFSLETARQVFRLEQWETLPELYGVLGNPVEHSLSPLLHNRLFQHYGMNRLYLPVLLDELDPWFSYLEEGELPFRGFSVTLPFKTRALSLIASLHSPVPVLNTLVREGTAWRGLNTDYPAFLKPLRRLGPLRGKRALVLGNGGVARTVVAALLEEGMKVTVVGRSRERLEQLAREFQCGSCLFEDLPVQADLCVNTTPVGQYPHSHHSPLKKEHLCFAAVYDLIYHPEQTRLLREAREKGLKTVSGWEMFVEQAALQFQAWTGVDPDRDLMRRIARQALAEREQGEEKGESEGTQEL